MTTICCQCGRHFWPGNGLCPGRPAGPVGSGREATGCNHEPCVSCERYKEKQNVQKVKGN